MPKIYPTCSNAHRTGTSSGPFQESQSDKQRYRTILADPPWNIQQTGSHGAIQHYPLMGVEAICSLRVDRQLAHQLTKLDLQEDRYLDLVGDPDWPKEKLATKMRGIRDEKARIQERLTTASNPVDSGYEVLETVLRLLENPLELYRTAKQRTRNVLNKAIFGKLYVQTDEQGPFVAGDELNEPFETVLMGRRESRFSDLLAAAERARLTADTSEGQTLVDLLNTALAGQCSSKAAMVGRQGVEP